MYKLILKDSNEVIDRIDARDLNTAKFLFMSRKQMKEEIFNKLYEVKNETK